MADDAVGCGRVTGTVGAPPRAKEPAAPSDAAEEVHVGVTVGQQAPEFTAPAYHHGGFTQVKLSEFADKWVLLCFYPGDFTFV